MIWVQFVAFMGPEMEYNTVVYICEGRWSGWESSTEPGSRWVRVANSEVSTSKPSNLESVAIGRGLLTRASSVSLV